MCLSVHRCICLEKKNQLDATESFIAIIICPTCFGHFYAHHQELETICVLLPTMVCSAWLLVVGGQVQAAGCASRKRNVAYYSLYRSHFSFLVVSRAAVCRHFKFYLIQPIISRFNLQIILNWTQQIVAFRNSPYVLSSRPIHFYTSWIKYHCFTWTLCHLLRLYSVWHRSRWEWSDCGMIITKENPTT